uniref:Protein SPT2 n=1 Tax=Hanseniaspora osmophila TaxID=56408 RepID=A0A1E5RWE1_9ASCO
MGYLDQLKAIQQNKKTQARGQTSGKAYSPLSSRNGSQSFKTSNAFTDPLDMKSSILPERYTREVDPAVKRLKELRRQKQLEEDAKRGGTLKVRKPSAARKARQSPTDKDSSITSTRFKKKIENKRQSMEVPQARTPAVKEKKLSFEQLMAQAEKSNCTNGADSSARSTPIPQKRAPVEISGWKKKKKNSPLGNTSTSVREKFKNAKPQESVKDVSEKQETLMSIPSSIKSGPSKKIMKKLEKRKSSRNGYYDDEENDSEFDDFIEEDDPGYDRSEIWKLMSNGRARSSRPYDYDDESDDMEADGFEILEEEEASRKYARLEDKKEEAWLKEHEKSKRKRLNK